MAPMLLTIDSELHSAPHTFKDGSHTLTCATGTLSETEPQSETPTTLQCQICFDDFAITDANDATITTAFCSSTCPAVLCRGCITEHVRVTVSDAFAGVLPKVRCPICLVPVTKTKWAPFASNASRIHYREASRTACSFQSPCCHNTSYSQLPFAIDDTINVPSKYIHPTPLQLVPSLKSQLEPLRRHTRRFANHKLTSSVFRTHCPVSAFVPPKRFSTQPN